MTDFWGGISIPKTCEFPNYNVNGFLFYLERGKFRVNERIYCVIEQIVTQGDNTQGSSMC